MVAHPPLDFLHFVRTHGQHAHATWQRLPARGGSLRSTETRRSDILQDSNTISPSIYRGVEEGTVPTSASAVFQQ